MFDSSYGDGIKTALAVVGVIVFLAGFGLGAWIF